MIELENISLSFDDVDVLRSISLTVEPGTTAVILGASGSGKSTILKILLGLLEPNAGDARINDRSMTTANQHERTRLRRSMGMVFQEGALFDSLTVRDNVGYRLIEQEVAPEEVDEAVHAKLEFVDLVGTMHKMPSELSGGMQRRVAIARALVGNPDVMLFDEPTTGLDPIVAKRITDHINDLRAQGITSVVVTHELPYAYRMADQIYLLSEGKFIFQGTVEEFKNCDDEYLVEFREYQ